MAKPPLRRSIDGSAWCWDSGTDKRFGHGRTKLSAVACEVEKTESGNVTMRNDVVLLREPWITPRRSAVTRPFVRGCRDES